MKSNLSNNKEQETRISLSSDAFRSILGMGLHTSIVNLLPGMITDIICFKKTETVFRLYKKQNEATIKFSFASDKASIS
ncbi:hypothetical protein [Aquimarina sp. I32.4]|uniref:hypothetical protein n=1 Tax=Aquimarina sp. I32.4 TaxID=2053903 RepID=UPI000CDF2343|nr:hypothetical protein [Aquimarina sp. I32.4]